MMTMTDFSSFVKKKIWTLMQPLRTTRYQKGWLVAVPQVEGPVLSQDQMNAMATKRGFKEMRLIQTHGEVKKFFTFKDSNKSK
jgi:hypothetical protein